MKLAIVKGHNRGTGAQSLSGIDEWTWNSWLASAMEPMLREAGIDYEVYVRDASLGYTAAMKKHARDIKRDDCTHAVEMHFNFHKLGSPARGYEFLHWWGSRKSRLMAQAFARSFGAHFPTIPARKGRWYQGWIPGTKALWLRKWNMKFADLTRGVRFCLHTHCAAIILEPGFASSTKDWPILESQIKRIARSYVEALIELRDSESKG